MSARSNEVNKIGEWSVVALYGELDVCGAPDLRQQLREHLERNRRLILDLSGVEFLDATGLAVLVGALKHARLAGGDLRIVANEGIVLKIFEITGLGEVFRVSPDAHTAAA